MHANTDLMPDHPAPRSQARSRSAVAAAVATVLALGVLAGCGSSSGSGSSGALTVESVTIDKPVTDSAVVRMTIDNQSGVDDELLEVSTTVAGRTSLHRTSTDSAGRSVMTMLAKVPVPAGRKTVFAPGGLHVMLQDLKGQLKVGDEVPLKLRFAKAGTISVVAKVVPIGSNLSDSSDDMSGMSGMSSDMSGMGSG